MKDLRLDVEGDGDLLLSGNDFAIGESDWQHREHLLLTEKGALKQFPETGVGAFKFLEGEDEANLLREVSIQFSADGMQVKKLSYVNKQLIFEAPYK